MKGVTATARHGGTRIRSTKRLKHTGNLFRKNLQLKRCLLILDLKAAEIISQRKEFYRQGIREFSCARKQT